MKRGKKLWVMLLVLVLLTGATVVVSKLNPENQEEEETEETAETAVLTLSGENVTGFSWTYNDITLNFNYADETWSYADDSAFPLDSSYVETALEAVKEIAATKTIEAVEDLAEYGLDEPVCTILVDAETDSEILVGDETELGGELYLSIGDGNVYLVDSDFLDVFDYELYDLLKWESIPDMSTAAVLSVESETQDMMIMYTGSIGISYSDSYGWCLVEDIEAGEGEDETRTAYYVLDTELTQAFISEVIGLSWDECINYNADEAALAEYGLDEPTATVSVIYTQTVEAATNEKDEEGNVIYEEQTTEEVFILEIGGYADSGCYARIAGSNMVYLIDATLSDTLLYTGYDELMIDDVLRMDMDTVDSADITIDGNTYTVVKETVTETDSEGNTTETSVYTLNGNEIEIEIILEGINDMASTGYAYGVTPERSEEISIVFHRNTENFTEVTLVFYQYDSSSCLVSLDGETTQFVERTSVTGLVEDIEQAVLDSETVEETEEKSAEETTAES